MLGVRTNIVFLRALCTDPEVVAGELDIGLVGRRVGELVRDDVPVEVLASAAQDLRMPSRRLTAVKWLAVGCVAVGVWLLAIGILYTDWPAIALAIVAIVFGVAGVRR